jgi:predicted nuclease of predicted toxin-antitoxin system
MRILLDECVDWRLLRDLTAHEARTVRQLGWEHVKNGTLLRLAATEFDVFVTVDSNLPYQQNIFTLDLAVVVLRARTTRLPDLRQLLPALHRTLKSVRHGELHILSWREML